MPQRNQFSEDSYIHHNITLNLSENYGYPGQGDRKAVRFKSDNRIEIGHGRYLEPDLVYYFDNKPLLVIEAKRKDTQAEREKAYKQALSYIRLLQFSDFPPAYFAISYGPSIEEVFHYSIIQKPDGSGTMEDVELLEELYQWEDLKQLYGVSPKEKPQIDVGKFREIFGYILAALNLKDEGRSPKLVLEAAQLILEFLKDENNYVSRMPYTKLDGHPHKQRGLREILSRYDWENSLGETLAKEYRRQIRTFFQGADLNQYLTPKPVIDFMVSLVNVTQNDKVLDFECGSGGFLIETVNRGVDIENIRGVDIAEGISNISKCYFALRFGITGPEIDSIPITEENGLYFSDNPKNWDLVIGNPAGGKTYDEHEELQDIDHVLEELDRDLDLNGRDDPYYEYNFSMQQAIQSAKIDGGICLVLPESVFANQKTKFLRKYISKYCQVEAIISLPRGVFREGTTTKFFRPGSKTSNQKMDILYARKKRGVEPGSGVDVSLEALDYPVFLASVQKPTVSNSKNWLKQSLDTVLEEWKYWQENQSLRPIGEEVVETIATESPSSVTTAEGKQEELIKTRGPLFDPDRKPTKPETKTETLIPEELEDVFEE